MPHRIYTTPPSLRFFALSFLSVSTYSAVFVQASVIDSLLFNKRDPAPAVEDGPPASAGSLRSNAYLPAQIGGIVGSYALSLVIVAALLLILAKKRREHLTAGDADTEQLTYNFAGPHVLQFGQQPEHPAQPLKSPNRNFSYPTSPREKDPGPYIYPPPQSTSTLGVNHHVDQRVVATDREMAQNQLEEMYKYVMEQDAAKQAGITLDRPPSPLSPYSKHDSAAAAPPKGILKKPKNKPATLDLERGSEKTQSRTSSIFSALRSPRKSKSIKSINISSPIMTPMSGTFPRQESQELSSIPPRHYQPAAPPPVPMDQLPYQSDSRRPSHVAPITPPDDRSPESTQSIDERLGNLPGHSRNPSHANSEQEPESAMTERSTAPLVGLPSSPKPGVNRFPSLPASPRPGATFPTSPAPGTTFPASPKGVSFPASPKPGASFSRPNAPSAVRTGGALPLRAYEPALTSPSAQTTKQTTFERSMPLSPGMNTPWTGAPQPYTPYQPFSPVIPVTPSLVTKADRKRMKQLQPKTPTLQMVKNDDEIW